MNEDRHDEWIKSSYSIRYFDLMLVGNAQGLGLVDVELITEFPTLKLDAQLEQDKLRKLRHITLCELWAMGAFELIRLMDEMVPKHTDLFSKDTIKEIKKVKKIFSEVRTPLVKFRKHGRGQQSYSGVPWFTFHPTKGYGFKLYLTKKNKIETKVVYRITLSDSLLNLFKRLEADIRANSVNARD